MNLLDYSPNGLANCRSIWVKNEKSESSDAEDRIIHVRYAVFNCSPRVQIALPPMPDRHKLEELSTHLQDIKFLL